MYKLIASDMDETFLDKTHRIPAANLEALATLKQLGVLFVPSSGRGYDSIMDNFAEIDPALMEGSYVISYNGGTINRFGDPTPLTRHALGHEIADAMWRLGVEHGVCMHAYTPDGRVLVRDCPPSEMAYLSSLKRVETYDEPTLSALPEVSKMLFMSDDFDWVQTGWADVVGTRLEELGMSGAADITFSSRRYLEVIPAGVNKGTGLVELAGILGVPAAETIGMGDSANDREMIEVAGLGLGVANVTPDVRPSCDAVLETTGMAGALPEVISHFVEPAR
ncbi:HAD-IIB family hydrolase [Olsenella uli]|uniref:HAD-IIB family hydrolase n=1 Tax=Olsenella uli TaxID=133926 RepID=UPI0012AC1183|nr:HAD family hydrolase [Olsenella uli]